jgi:hypothetical protein
MEHDVIDDFPADLQSWVNSNIGNYKLEKPGFNGLVEFEQEPRIRFMVDGTVLMSIKCDERKGKLYGRGITLRDTIDTMKTLLPYPLEPITVPDQTIQSLIDESLPLPISEETIFGTPAKEYILHNRRNMKRAGLVDGHFVLSISDNMILVENHSHRFSKIFESVLTKHFEVKYASFTWSNLADRLLEFASSKILFIDGIPY